MSRITWKLHLARQQAALLHEKVSLYSIFENNLNKMEYILKRFEENMKQREKLMENKDISHEILNCDPLQFCSYG